MRGFGCRTFLSQPKKSDIIIRSDRNTLKLLGGGGGSLDL